MRRRDFIAALGGAATLPLAVRAQDKPHRVGYLTLNSGPTPSQSDAFERGLQELGYRPGQNIIIDYRWGAGQLGRLAALAQELVQLRPDVIVVAATPVVQAVKNATAAIPIVIAHSADPVQTGFAASLARPGGNITGLSLIATDLAPKRIELLRELLPNIKRVAFLAHGADPAAKLFMDQTQVATDQFGLQMQRVVVRGPEDFDQAFAAMVSERADVIVIQPIFLQAAEQTRRIIELAAHHRLPSVSDYWEEFAARGGLLSYGASRSDLYRRTATYVDKILKGASPSELPIELPTRFEMGLNLKTAKALGLTVPPTIIARADQIIE